LPDSINLLPIRTEHATFVAKAGFGTIFQRVGARQTIFDPILSLIL